MFKSKIDNADGRELSGEAAPTHNTTRKSMVSPDLFSESQQSPTAPLISVVIPCYNQAHFLGEAIESVLNQTYTHFEIIVVNDGSTDHTSEVASLYSSVRCIKQVNRGLSSARNTGIRESKGDYLVFLDADDRLLPDALELGLHCFRDCPQCVFVHGGYRFITFDGFPFREPMIHCIDKEHYLALLRKNYIGVPATVMFRRDILEYVGGFDTRLDACEDYDLYLRIARIFPIKSHDMVVVEYRMHNQNMSRNAQLMLQTMLSVLRSQLKYVHLDKRYREAYKVGIRDAKNYYGMRLLKQIYYNMWTHKKGSITIKELKLLLSYIGWKTFVLHSPIWIAKLISWKIDGCFERFRS